MTGQKSDWAPLIVGIGGTTRPGSTTERALAAALRAVERRGGRTLMLDGSALDLPLYAPHLPARDAKATALLSAVREADGVILASPGYHGTISGQLKNAVDYLEDLRDAEAPYLENRAVGCVATAAGWQAAVNTLAALRGIAHALRGWPTPLGVALNTAEPIFDAGGAFLSERNTELFDTLAGQVLTFARRFRTEPAAA